MRPGWLEILVIVVLVLILFGHNKIPGMMKNLADGINVFKREMKKNSEEKDKKVEIASKTSNLNAKKPKKTGKKRSVKNKIKK